MSDQTERRVIEAAKEWHASGADVVSPDGRAHRAIRELRRAVAALAAEEPEAPPEPEPCEIVKSWGEGHGWCHTHGRRADGCATPEAMTPPTCDPTCVLDWPHPGESCRDADWVPEAMTPERER